MRPEWQSRPLADLLSRPLAYGVLKPGERVENGVPLVRIQDVHTGRLDPTSMHRISDALHQEFRRTELRGGELLLSIVGTLGKVVEVPPALSGANISRALCVIGCSPEVVREYLKQFLQSASIQRWFEKEGRGNAQPVLNIGLLRNLAVVLPPVPEQRKIAAILTSVDDAIEATHAVIDQLQVVKKAMMAELLTRGLPGRHTKFKMTEIGEVPEEWDVVRLGNVCERMFVGIAQAATHAYVAEGGVPIIRTTNVRANRLRVDDILRINDKFASEMRSKALRAGDVLSARTGYPGTSIVVPPEFDGAQCFTLLVSRPGPRLIGKFLCHVMNSALGERIVGRGQAGGAQQNLNVGVFEEAVIALPTATEQRSIVSTIDAAYEREVQEEAGVVGLRELKAALMSVLLTGEVRVTPDEDAA
jgi:type I restriction enzyme S subunit